MYIEYYYTQTNTINVNKTWGVLQKTRGYDEQNINKTWAVLQKTRGYDEQNIVLMQKP